MIDNKRQMALGEADSRMPIAVSTRKRNPYQNAVPIRRRWWFFFGPGLVGVAYRLPRRGVREFNDQAKSMELPTTE
jgi:hypothetical protein